MNGLVTIGQNADCNNLLTLIDTIHHSKAISGYGNSREFDGNDLENDKFFEREENSIWYLITMPDSGMFTFDIKTQSKLDDWDFLLFDYKTKFCKRIADQKIVPLRTNLSRSPITGISKNATEAYAKAGINSNYSKAVIGNKGQQYVLVVNNPKAAGSKHTLVLHFPKKEGVKPKTQPVSPDVKIPINLFTLSIKDRLTNKPVPSRVSIAGLRDKTILLDTAIEYQAEITQRAYVIDVNASATGYMLTTKNIKIPKGRNKFSESIYLEKITKGKRVNLKGIQFYGNRADFLPTAKNALSALLIFMQQNSNIKIEIEGHVNGPGQKNSNDYKLLSLNRTLAVKQYLTSNKISENRIKYTGYGNSRMLFPMPKTEGEHSANRRVEIKITANE